jgi:hypothetical protein
MLVRMRLSRSASWATLVLASCFAEAPDVSGGSEMGTPTETTSTTTVGTTGSPTASSAEESAAATSAEAETSASTGTSGPAATTAGTTSDGSSTTASSAVCHALDFDGEALACQPQQLSFALGDETVTFAEAVDDPEGPCIEHVEDGDGWTAPLEAQYLYLQVNSNVPATISFTAPASSVTFSIGPHTSMPNFISICADTTSPCSNLPVSSNEGAPMEVDLELAGAQVVYIWHEDGTAFLGIDDLEVCFQ